MFNIYKYTVNNQISETTHFFQVLVLEIVHIISFIDNKRTHEGLSNGSKKIYRTISCKVLFVLKMK